MSSEEHSPFQDAGGADLDETLLGSRRTLTMHALADRLGTDPEIVRAYWRTLGLPITEDDEFAFTEDDAAALARIWQFASAQSLTERALTTLIRSTGHTTERLVLWQVEAIIEAIAERDGIDDVAARLQVLDQLPDIAPVLEAQLVHAFRRQLAAVAARFAFEFSQSGAEERAAGDLPLPRAVGFADIVSSTKRTSGLNAHELADFVERFEATARDIITTAGGRVVKTIGDAVLFVTDDVAHGAQVALGLADSGGSGDDANGFPQVRVSLVWGRLLSRFGDVFGPMVNLAARLNDIAEPGTVLCDRDTARLLSVDPRFALTAQPACEVRGLGPVEPVRLQWAYRG